MANLNTFEYNLEKTSQKIFDALLELDEYDRTFSPRSERAEDKGKDGFWITNHEHVCIVKSFLSIERVLTTSFQVLIDSMKHQGIQRSILDQIVSQQTTRIEQLELYVRKLSTIAKVDLFLNDYEKEMDAAMKILKSA